MSIEKLKPSFSLDELRLRALEQIVPEAFADGQINWETLREVLGTHIEDEDAGAESFGLSWPGKRDARRMAAQQSKGTLVPMLGEGIDEATTENIFIEGDNLEVLKLLQKPYSGRIKMIYIDPPYNTGNDFIYKDNFTEPLEDYLKKTKQMGEEGELLTTNTKSDGRFHSNWLNMIYPRLRLARNLLREDGIIFISIDDNEVYNLRQVMNEVFGEENFKGQITRATGTPTGQGTNSLVNEKDYIIVYSKSAEGEFLGLPFSEEDEKRYDLEDKNGRYLTRPLRKTGGEDRREDRPSMYFAVKAPDGSEVFPIGPGGYESRWRCGPPTYEKLLANGFIEWKKVKENGTEVWKPYQKFYLEGRTKQPSNLWTDIDGNKKASREVSSIFGDKVFDFPKPVELIKRCCQISVGHNGLVLDFFAGSGTTAHAVLDLNKKDGGNRKFICVQLPEVIKKDTDAYKAGFRKVSDITKERILRVSKKIKEQSDQELVLDGELHDYGFKVYKLEKSNFQAWQDYRGDDIRQLEVLFASHETPIVDDWKEQDVLTELLLIEGFPLNSKILLDASFIENRVVQVESDFSTHRLFICLELQIKDKTIERVAALPDNDIFICMDRALTDAAKVWLTDAGNVRTI